MEVEQIQGKGVRLSIKEDGKEVARARVYFLDNDLGHNQPWGFLEDVYVEEEFRSKGYGSQIVQAAIEEARKAGCYKLLGTSRYSRDKVHQFYLKLGFTDRGKEFRIDL